MSKIEIKTIEFGDIKDDYRVFDLDRVASPNIYEQVANIINKLQEISANDSIIPAIEDTSFCFINEQNNFIKKLRAELQKSIINFGKAYLYKKFYDVKNCKDKEIYFLITP